jgi:hypothetical protein
MIEHPYSREELAAVDDEWPTRGVWCTYCNHYIPQFADLTAVQTVRISYLRLQSRLMMATAELQVATGCPQHWADLWIRHLGHPILDYDAPASCPYCRMPLRTNLAKQCRHCRRDWHHPKQIRWLGDDSGA